jgi:hypothetical protein
MRMRIYLKRNKPMKILLLICLSTFLLTSLVGFRDIKKEGVACEFQARIVDVRKSSPDNKVLLVKQIRRTRVAAKVEQEKIYVLVTGDTLIGFKGNTMKFDDLRIKMAILIEGFKVIEEEEGTEVAVVQATRIQPLLE